MNDLPESESEKIGTSEKEQILGAQNKSEKMKPPGKKDEKALSDEHIKKEKILKV